MTGDKPGYTMEAVSEYDEAFLDTDNGRVLEREDFVA
jgi:hypothetical protein